MGFFDKIFGGDKLKRLLLSGFEKNTRLQSAVGRKDELSFRAVLEGLTNFTVDLDKEFKALTGEAQRKQKDVARYKVHINELIKLFAPQKGEIFEVINAKPIVWEKVKEKTSRAQVVLSAAIAEHNKIKEELKKIEPKK